MISIRLTCEPSRDYLNRYNITRDDDIYGHMFTKKKETKLKEFNFKLLHGISPGKKKLEKRNTRANVMCADHPKLLITYCTTVIM